MPAEALQATVGARRPLRRREVGGLSLDLVTRPHLHAVPDPLEEEAVSKPGFPDSPHVVIVDDDPEDVELMLLALGEIGIDSAIALESGPALLSHLMQQPRDDLEESLVLLDLRMPGMDGIETLGEMRDLGLDDVRVVVVSGSRADEEIWVAQSLGASGYIVKPPTASKLRSVLSGLGTYDFSVVPLPGEGW